MRNVNAVQSIIFNKRDFHVSQFPLSLLLLCCVVSCVGLQPHSKGEGLHQGLHPAVLSSTSGRQASKLMITGKGFYTRLHNTCTFCPSNPTIVRSGSCITASLIFSSLSMSCAPRQATPGHHQSWPGQNLWDPACKLE